MAGCDTGIGHELARHLDFLGFHVFAGCLDTSSEGAQGRTNSAEKLAQLGNLLDFMDFLKFEIFHFILQFVIATLVKVVIDHRKSRLTST